MSHRIFAAAGFLITFFLVTGCSGVNAPVEPGIEAVPDTTSPVLTGAQAVEDFSSAHTLWGYYLVSVNENHTEWDLVPLRQVENHWNVLSWMENGPCYNCFKLAGITPSGMGTLYVNVEFTHPFALPNLTGFDVRGIAMFTGTHGFPEAGLTVSNRSDGEGEVINPDGYTSLYNPTTAGSGPGGFQGYIPGKFSTHTIPNCTLNPYMRYISDDVANVRNAFYAGETITVTYEIDMPDGAFIFGYAVDASWAPPIHKPVINPMEDFGLEANCPEPWKLEIEEQPVGAGLTDIGGQTNLIIDVYDWQGKASHMEPTVECPEIFDGNAQAAWSVDFTGYTRYECGIENENFAGVGNYKCLVKVYDYENDDAPDWLDLSAYQVFNLEVHYSGPDTDPVAIAAAEPLFQATDMPVHFHDDGSYDPDGGSIVLYEWDWDNDGIFDELGSDLYHEWETEGIYHVQFRVTDDESATDTLNYPIQIQISNEFFNPIAMAEFEPFPQTVCEQVHLFDTGSFDPDGGDIALYEWDLDNDGTYDESGADIFHAWNVPGVYEVQFRVTDDESATGTLPAPLEVVVENALPTAEAFASDYSVDVFEDVTLNGTGSYDNDCSGVAIVEWEWDIDFDGLYDVSGPELNTHWEEPGLMLVQLRVTDNEGGMDELDEPLAIEVLSPPLAFAISDTNFQLIGQPVNFLDDGSYDPDGGSIVLYEWDWNNDGLYDDSGPSVSHTWNTSGVYNVQLQVTDDEGATDTLDVPLEITIHELPVAISDPNGGSVFTTVMTEVLFSDYGSYDPDGGSITMYEWDWNNDGTYDDTGASVLHDFGTYGEFQVQFRVTDDEGTTDKLDDPISIRIEDYDSWVKTWGGSGTDTVEGIAAGSDGSIYSCGRFTGTVDFDPGTGVCNLVSYTDYNPDAYICKFGPAGDFCWAYSWGAENWDKSDRIIVAPEDGVYVTGQYLGTVDFDPGTGTEIHTAVGSEDCFLAKYSFNGNFQWVRVWGTTGNDTVHDLISDGTNNNIYVVGAFKGTCDFDTGPSTDSKTTAGVADCYILKHNSSGTYMGSTTWGGTLEDYCFGICTDYSGSLFVTGKFGGTCDFDPGTGHYDVASNGQSDCFMSKFNTSLSWTWTKTWGGIVEDESVAIYYGNGNLIYVAGYFGGTVDLDPGAGNAPHTSAGSYDGYLTQFDLNGTFQWGRSWGGTGQDVVESMVFDYNYNRCLITGDFDQTADFDPGAGVNNRTPTGSYDTFVLNISDSGNYTWVKILGGNTFTYGLDIDVSYTNIWIGGFFANTTDFDPGAGTQNRSSNGDLDNFVLKLQPTGTW